MLVKYGMLSHYGVDIPIAIIGIESKVFTVVINIVVGIILGCQPIISYNYGAKNYKRVKLTYRYALQATVIIGIIATLLFEFLPTHIVGMFGEPTNLPNPEDYWQFANMTFRIFLSLVTFTCIIKMTSIFFQAVGKPIHAIISSLTRDIICFIPLIIILPGKFGIEGILYAAPAADFIAMIVAVAMTIYFMKGLDKENELTDTTSPTLQASKQGLIITISREHGSSGKQIGKVVAEKLKIPFYYKEIAALAAQGACVIIGRAADYVLREYKNIIRIFIYAPEEYRIKRVMEVYGDTYTEAIKNIHHSDEARASYYHSISNTQWGDVHNYDILIDSSVGVEECSEIIYSFINHIKKRKVL